MHCNFFLFFNVAGYSALPLAGERRRGARLQASIGQESRTGAIWSYNLTRRSRSALPITDTLEALMAAAAIIGDSNRPNTG